MGINFHVHLNATEATTRATKATTRATEATARATYCSRV